MRGSTLRSSNNPTGVNQYSNSIKPAKDDNISIRLSSSMKAKFQASAEAEGMSLSSWCVAKMLGSL